MVVGPASSLPAAWPCSPWLPAAWSRADGDTTAAVVSAKAPIAPTMARPDPMEASLPNARPRRSRASASTSATASRATHTPSTIDTDSAWPEWAPNGRPATRLTAQTAISTALVTATAAATTRLGRSTTATASSS